MTGAVNLLIIEAPYYHDISAELTRGAVAVLERAGAGYQRIEVPGAFEIPAAIRFAADAVGRMSYDGYIALGCIIRGETSHYDYVCAESARALQDLATRDRLAIGYGILTVENHAQAWARAAIDKGNKGGFVAGAALTMIKLKHHFGLTE